MTPRVLVVDDKENMRRLLSRILAGEYAVEEAEDGARALSLVATREYDVVVTDIRMPGADGFELLAAVKARAPDTEVVMMTGYATVADAVRAMKQGAFDYLEKPFDPDAALGVVARAAERKRRSDAARASAGSGEPEGFHNLVGRSARMREAFALLERAAGLDITVLLLGETGTGKELAARAVHYHSARRERRFVPVNCGALPGELVESELFGHARGAFTGATGAKPGLFEEAEGGTLFLDEVGELPLPAQVKLLRVLQEGEIRPVGESRAEKVDVRVIAATLRDLGKLVERGEFREDLYYRLNVVNLRMPPLRERREDIPLLARAFIHRFNRQLNREPPVEGLNPEAEALMAAYAWPGNVRELENAMERAVLLADEALLLPSNLPERLWAAPPQPVAGSSSVQQPSSDLSLKRAMRELEETYIRAALRRTRGNRTRAAEVLDISHRALLYKIKEYGIDPDAEAEKGS